MGNLQTHWFQNQHGDLVTAIRRRKKEKRKNTSEKVDPMDRWIDELKSAKMAKILA